MRLSLPVNSSSPSTIVAKPKSDNLTQKLSSNRIFSGWKIIQENIYWSRKLQQNYNYTESTLLA